MGGQWPCCDLMEGPAKCTSKRKTRGQGHALYIINVLAVEVLPCWRSCFINPCLVSKTTCKPCSGHHPCRTLLQSASTPACQLDFIYEDDGGGTILHYLCCGTSMWHLFQEAITSGPAATAVSGMYALNRFLKQKACRSYCDEWHACSLSPSETQSLQQLPH
eukprot:1146664-Pelagomonas_calceolata.AAC.4